MTKFLELIPQDTLAVASFRSKAYTRAVMHFESFIMEKKQEIQEHLGFLQVRKCSLRRNPCAVVPNLLSIINGVTVYFAILH